MQDEREDPNELSEGTRLPVDEGFEQRMARLEAGAHRVKESLQQQEIKSGSSRKGAGDGTWASSSIGKALAPLFFLIGSLLVGGLLGWLIDGFQYGMGTMIGAFFGVIFGCAVVVYRLARQPS